MKVLVTGAGGFIGSHVAELFLREGHGVRALVRYNGRNDWGHLAELPEDIRDGLEVQLGDVTDPFFLSSMVGGCDVVLHLAALIGIPYSYFAPASYVATNILGTMNVLEACRNAQTPRVIVTSTSEVYGTALYTPIDEKHPLQAQSPYSASKIGADKLAESYFASFGVPVVTLRPFNTYGPRQSARAVIPTILSQALGGHEQVVIGNSAPKRDLTFVTDTARAFLLAASAEGIVGETIHFGQGTAVSIGELADLCLEVIGSNARVQSEPRRFRPENSEVQLLLCNRSKAESMLRWTPRVALRDGLKMTADYMRAKLANYRSGEYIL